MTIRAKYDSNRAGGSSDVAIFFDDVDEPVYPMPGDQYELYDEEAPGFTVQAIVTRVLWQKKVIFLEINWATANRQT